MKTSRAPVQSPRISASVRLTCLPGRLPRTSRSLAMTSSTSVGPEGAVEEDAIHPRSERSACSRGRSSSSQSGHLTAARDKRGSRGRFGPAARTLGKPCGLCAHNPQRGTATTNAARAELVRKGGKRGKGRGPRNLLFAAKLPLLPELLVGGGGGVATRTPKPA